MPRLFGTLAVIVGFFVWAGCPVAGKSCGSSVSVGLQAGDFAEENEDGSKHFRLSTENGPVHVWLPDRYDATTAGTVLYVHGYYDTLDDAWRTHQLPAQFKASGRNALFIAPEAPIGNDATVNWENLPALLAVVRARTALLTPPGTFVAVAHSGGFRTVLPWLSSGLLEEVILLDGLYENEEDFTRWAQRDPSRLVLVGGTTSAKAEALVDAVDGGLSLAKLPAPPHPEAAAARVLFVKPPSGHMELITEGKVLPAVLQLSRVKALTR